MMDGLVGEIAREGLVNLASNFTMKAMPSVSRYDLPLKYRGPVKISSSSRRRKPKPFSGESVDQSSSTSGELTEFSSQGKNHVFF
ncbi:hypothetical protein Peur_034092 [Populus x canadensis]